MWVVYQGQCGSGWVEEFDEVEVDGGEEARDGLVEAVAVDEVENARATGWTHSLSELSEERGDECAEILHR